MQGGQVSHPVVTTAKVGTVLGAVPTNSTNNGVLSTAIQMAVYTTVPTVQPIEKLDAKNFQKL